MTRQAQVAPGVACTGAEGLCDLADAIGVPAFVVAPERDGGFRFVRVNTAYGREYGVAFGDVVGHRLDELLAPEAAASVEEHYRRCVAAAERAEHEEELVLTGRRFWLRTALNPVIQDGVVHRIFGTTINITDRKRLEFALLAARDRAERASQAKSNFLTNMSHELRTPLNAVIGFSEMIAGEVLGPVGTKAYAEYAGDINFAGNHLLGIVNDVLDMARIEAGKVEMAEDEIALETLLAGVERITKERAARSRLDLRVAATPPGISVVGDERLLRQALINVVGNAVKFTKGGGTVELAAHVLADGQICFTVSDTGIGISAKDLPTALAPFGRVAPPTTAEYEGTGLGLPITKAVLELHGGHLFVNSEAGLGTTVFLALPADRLRTADRQPPQPTIGGLRDFFIVDGRHVGEGAEALDEAALGGLPVGAILLDGAGRVLRYNETESRFSGLHPMAVVGRDFFRDIAPCTFTPEFHGRFRAGFAGGEVSTLFSYVFNFAKAPAKVLIEMRAGERPGTAWLFIRWV